MSLQTKNDDCIAESSPNTLFHQLQQLVREIIIPNTKTLIPTLIARLEEYQEAVNDKDVANWANIKNRLMTSELAIIERFTSTLTQKSGQQINKAQDAVTLELMDNEELDQRLLWLDATHYFENSENSQRICRIKSNLESLYPQHGGTLPATPERLCESFSAAIIPLNPNKNVAQRLFSWFADHFKPVADDLWQKTDQLLLNKKLAPGKEPPDKKSIRNPDIVAPPSPSRADQKQPTAPDPATIAPELTDNVSDRLVSRMDDLLTEGDPSAREQDNRVSPTDLMETLSTLQLEMIDQQTSPAKIYKAITNSLAAKGITATLSCQHQDRINAVGWLFHHILEGENLPNEIIKATMLLQIPILRQAITDDNLLANYHHPARRLLAALTSSAKHCQTPSLGEHVVRLIEHTVKVIIADHGASPAIFQDCLAGFRHNLEDIVQMQRDDPDDLPEDDGPLPLTVAENKSDEHHEPATQPDANELTEEIILVSDTPESRAKTEEKPSDPEPDDSAQQAPEQESNTQQEPTPAEILHCGQWVEFIGRGDSHRLRCKLARVSEDQQRYIFVNRSGMTVAQRSASELQKDIESGSVQILAENPIFDRAIQAVLGRFRKQPLKQ